MIKYQTLSIASGRTAILQNCIAFAGPLESCTSYKAQLLAHTCCFGPLLAGDNEKRRSGAQAVMSCFPFPGCSSQQIYEWLPCSFQFILSMKLSQELCRIAQCSKFTCDFSRSMRYATIIVARPLIMHSYILVIFMQYLSASIILDSRITTGQENEQETIKSTFGVEKSLVIFGRIFSRFMTCS